MHIEKKLVSLELMRPASVAAGSGELLEHYRSSGAVFASLIFELVYPMTLDVDTILGAPSVAFISIENYSEGTHEATVLRIK